MTWMEGGAVILAFSFMFFVWTKTNGHDER